MSERDPVDTNQAAAGRRVGSGRTPVAAIAIGVVALAIVAVTVFVFLQSDRSEPPVGAASSSPSASPSPSATPTATPEPTPQPTAAPAAQWEMGRVFERGDYLVGCICAATGAGDALMVALGRKDDVFTAITEDGTNWDVTIIDPASAGTFTGADVVDGTIVATAVVDIADAPKDALILVRDQDSAEWRSVDWRAELPDANEEDIDLGRPVYVAIGQDRTLIVIADGTVFLTSGRLP